MSVSARRIVVLGKTGAGKSSLANTILGETVFEVYHSPQSGTHECKAKEKSINGRSITLIDTPGFFDTERPEEEMKREIVRCITESSPGPHAFLIVLKVGKYTVQEQDVINKVNQCFSEDALRFTTVLFTYGEELPEGMKIEKFVSKNKNLSDLVKKCGDRCHVVDNKRWKNSQQDEYRSNRFQVEELLNTIEKMIQANGGDHFTSEMLQECERKIQEEEERIRQSSPNMPREEIREQAKSRGYLLKFATGFATGVTAVALFGLFLVRKR